MTARFSGVITGGGGLPSAQATLVGGHPDEPDQPSETLKNSSTQTDMNTP